MSYQKTEWKTGDIITAQKLNNIQDGIAGNSSDTAKVIKCTCIAGQDAQTENYIVTFSNVKDLMDACVDFYENYNLYTMVFTMFYAGAFMGGYTCILDFFVQPVQSQTIIGSGFINREDDYLFKYYKENNYFQIQIPGEKNAIITYNDLDENGNYHFKQGGIK